MTLDELIDWVEEGLQRVPEGKLFRSRRKHARRLYNLLAENAEVLSPDEARREWHEVARKVAAMLGEEPPPQPDVDSETQRVRKSLSYEGPPRRAKSKPGEKRRRLARKPKEPPVEINAQFQAAIDAVASGKPIVFITGGAGTGKSTLIRELRRRFEDRNCIVLAPTGVAALNAGGQTIHSFCRLPLRPFMPGDAREARDPELIESLGVVIIDEISMVRADTLDGVDAFLRRNRKPELPFGGVQMVLVGDLFQLPPVVTSKDSAWISQNYETPFFFSARALTGLRFSPVELEIVYRQKDSAFASLLARIREDRDAGGAIAEINARCAGRQPTGQYLTLTPTRDAAARENEMRLQKLTGRPKDFTGTREGTFLDSPDERLPAPAHLVLKKGAQVMFVRNDSEGKWVNGTIGIVESMRDGEIDVRLEDGILQPVERVEWEDIEYKLDETRKVVEEVAGSFRQFPLMLAWSVTIHKAQGLTLSKVLVDLSHGAFAEGQVYVALSRCQSLEGLALRRPIRQHEVRCSREAVHFHERIRSRMQRRIAVALSPSEAP